jgi:hypothetical protein
MAEIKKIGVSVQTVATISLNDQELAALDALVGYGLDSFLKVFYEKLGRSYLEPFEPGLRSFFEAVGGCRRMTSAAKECREFLELEERRRQQENMRLRSLLRAVGER